MKDNYSLIMAGGIGSRFWPMSTPERPKQFLDVLGIGKSLLQMTYERLLYVSPVENIYILTNTDYKEMVLEQLPDLTPDQVLCEPQRKNTAPCIAYAAAKIHALNANANLIVSPADHLIIQQDNFAETVNTGLKASAQGRIATIGIKPIRPDTGYGYIEFDSSKESQPNDVIAVDQFREKPDLATAQSFLDAGNFYWNSGIFIWKSATVLNALKEFQPELYDLFAGDLSFYNTSNEQEKVNHCFEVCEDISIDFAVMEHAKNIDIVLSNFDWSDLGTWGSLNSHLNHDEKGNSTIGAKTHIFNTEDCIINIENDKTAVIDSLKGYIVIQSEDRLMILKKENEQALKEFVKVTK
ncbi:mannose-1-phosphate guanylyltransferase [Crocinitomicaceae bacterium]|nr:mannose-1-phosphate guanylyltransferase [Crocinitomicaceae bacterium]MDC0098725.1 mannose-1-phosphate guanylyltransferase [Crocinitomicaceae bacterium]MDC1196100.1 mannose-1-phosphate guanylyltransferase [Crocinitomicaceae bacterium]MDC1282596.1 mannose-1-phosphate guanylyltransferase [Crocinitomicaceae bacterium]|tara:strand:- start:8111 stop:9169 length:1059 start_codon:yes stop_codon:yes gene_type:complete